MTNEEAIRELKVGYLGDSFAMIEAKKVALEALKKQIPKKPTHCIYTVASTGRIHHHIYCGKCGGYRQRVYQGDKYCRECGTPIDWEETNAGTEIEG